MSDARGWETQLRLFVAVELPAAWLDALAAIQTDLRRRLDAAARLRWARPEGVHLTLKFIGEVGASLRPGIEAALAAAVASPPGLTLTLGGLGTFPERGAPRVLWVGLEGQTRELAALASRIDARLEGAGLAREKRALLPHLTLARVGDRLAAGERASVGRALAAVNPGRPGPMVVERVSLMRSHLGPGGARYERLATFPP